MKNTLILLAVASLSTTAFTQDLNLYSRANTDLKGGSNTETGVSFRRNLSSKWSAEANLGFIQDEKNYWHGNTFKGDLTLYYNLKDSFVFLSSNTDFRGNYYQEVGMGYLVKKDKSGSLTVRANYRLDYPYAGYSNGWTTSLVYTRPLD